MQITTETMGVTETPSTGNRTEREERRGPSMEP